MFFNNENLYNEKYINIIKENQKTIPVKITKIASELGITIYRANMSENISGAIFGKNIGYDNEEYIIYVNGCHSINKQRFTIAHEIAHFLLHKNQIGDNLTDSAMYRSKLSNAKERQANALAAEILMPLQELRNYVYNIGVTNIEALSEIFKVSKETMSIRLRDLRKGNFFLEE